MRSGPWPCRTSRSRPSRQLQLTHAGQEGLGLHLDSLREQLPRAGTQDIRQGIVDLVGLTKADNIDSLFHGVSLSSRGSGRLDTRLDTPPFSMRRSRMSQTPEHPSRRAPIDTQQG
jgi:hypothetical protein